MEDFKNEFSWSKSRDNIFRECARKYYFNHYGSWGGWSLDASERVRKTYVLKQLKNRFMWVGEVVHRCIEISMKNMKNGIAPLPLDEIVQITINLMRQDFKYSREGRYWQRPKSCALFEHEYNVQIEDEKWQEIARHGEACIRNFYTSEVFEKISAIPTARWLEIENLSSFQFNEAKVFVKLDYAYKEEKGRIVIMDWKTGRGDTEDNSVQLGCYAIYGLDKWEVNVNQIETVEFNLASNSTTSYEVSGTQLEAVKGYIKGSMDDMRQLLRDRENNVACEEDFPKTDQTALCQNCNFLKVCKP